MVAKTLLPVIFLVCMVTADYELLVTIYSFSNPENKCAVCRQGPLEAFGCCDNPIVKNATECSLETRSCENVLSVCLRPSSEIFSDALCPNGNSVFISDVFQETAVTFNPPLRINSTGKTWDTTNSQLYITLNDNDFGSGFQLVDSYPLNVLVPGTRVSRMTVSGQYGLATVELEFSLICTNGFLGPDCHRPCDRPSCSCDPGFAGVFCEIDIDECESVDCSGRGVCQDGVNSYSCTCQDGYTGTNCEVNRAGAGVGISLALLLVLAMIVAVVVTVVVVRSKKQTKGDYSVQFRADVSEAKLNLGYEEGGKFFKDT